jgi:tetratricopeptide (TPR) repeat protein
VCRVIFFFIALKSSRTNDEPCAFVCNTQHTAVPFHFPLYLHRMTTDPTPYLIALAALISLHCEEEFPLLDDAASLDAVLQDRVLQQRPNDRISQLLQAAPPQFQKWLEIAASSIDAFFDLIQTIQQSIQTGTVDAYSANGLLLRSVCEGLEELEFHEQAALFEEFRREVYNEPHVSNKDSSTEEDPAAHMMRFQACLQEGERVDAVHALHQYMVQQESEDILPFCSIVLAAMHHPTDPALVRQATDEAVRVAQQSQDASCVAFALGWLSKIAPSKATNLMERCVARATEAHLPTLAAGANLSLALQALQSHPPEDAWSYWIRASSEPPTEESGDYQPTRLTDSATDCRHILARQKMVAAGIHDTFGSHDLSRVASLSALQCHRDDISDADAQILVQNLARTTMFGSGGWKFTNTSQGLLDKDDSQPRPCIYGNALETILSLQKAYNITLPARDYAVDVGLIALEWSIMRGELTHAETLLTSLQGQIYAKNEMSMDLEQQKCLLLARRGRWDEAIRNLKALVSKTEPTKQAELLLQIAIHTVDSHSRGFADALKPLEECLSISQQHAMQGLHSSGLAVLAKIHFMMGDATQAVTLLRSVMSNLLQSAHVWLQGDAYLTMAQALLKLHKQNAALRALDQSEELFRMCEDTRQLAFVYYLKARIFDTQEKTKDRDLAAEKFIVLSSYMEEGRGVKIEPND